MGYAFFGQFIGHDLAKNRSPIKQVPPPEKIENNNSGRLDLDHLYGFGPQSDRGLYLPNGKFRIGATRPSGYPRDLPREPNGEPHMNDKRNDENLVVAQLTTLFLKFHNYVAGEVEANRQSPLLPLDKDLYSQARRLVTWHYQWIVLHDFLPRILDEPDTLKAAWEAAPQGPNPDYKIPVEFAMAAFRFGHSMIGQTYALNSRHPLVTMAEMFFYTSLPGLEGGTVWGLPDDRILDWRLFLDLGFGPYHGNRCRPIDTKLAGSLSFLPEPLRNKSEPDDPIELAVRTLQRGSHIGLASGQDVAGPKGLNVRVLTPDEIAEGGPEEVIKHGFHEQTPLWYYLLKEAEVLGGGARLGPAGSRIVARVFMECLLADSYTYPSVCPNWKPTLPGENETFTLPDVVRCVGDVTTPWG